MGIIVKWTRSEAGPSCPDEYVDEIDSDEISKLRARKISTRSWGKDENGKYTCFVFRANLEIDRGNPTTIRLKYLEKDNKDLVSKGWIALGTSTLTIADGQRSGTLSWTTNGQSPIVVEWYDSRKYHKGLARPEQPAFRGGVMELFGSKCAITGCVVHEALEAAHVIPVSEGGSYAPDNGILLRRDIHRLFDLNLLAINPECLEVNIADQISNDYGQYAKTAVNLPDSGPKVSDFSHRWKQFLRFASN
ncbi:MAG: HNH endonuclease signature motif containing protein [Alphaproteobacteria bacterium]|nr:HNH endonuclease signature motif containing protein [Alphaproteobacteria bacterium]